ncbi:MAG: hypothetical protein N4A33_12180 [Bacteriovoracaceae bacterium]|jgi:hypothetical protein|nr:hypothetical protein [Bacteriovoracaceae bacterium]
MKKLLIAVLLLGSVSSFANDCKVFLHGVSGYELMELIYEKDCTVVADSEESDFIILLHSYTWYPGAGHQENGTESEVYLYDTRGDSVVLSVSATAAGKAIRLGVSQRTNRSDRVSRKRAFRKFLRKMKKFDFSYFN